MATFDKGELTIPFSEISEIEYSDYDGKYYVTLANGFQFNVTQEEYNDIIEQMED
jgi:hypothetical protein